MKTIEDLKNELMEHLGTLDKDKMGLTELHGYVDILRIVNDMMRKDPSEVLRESIEKMHTVGNGVACCCDTKEGDNG